MPQVTVYVREDDLAKWKGIEKKSEWLHLALHDMGIASKDTITSAMKSGVLGKSDVGISIVESTSQPILKPRTNKLCKNGHPLDDRGRCFGKGCEYS